MSTAALNIQPSDPPHHGPACDPILTVSAVSQVFPGAGSAASVHALDDVSLTVAPGEFVAIVGPSGCGKSTLLRLAAGLGRPTKGGIAFGGDILTGPRREIGMIFQDSVMLPWFTVLENVVLPQRIARQDLPQARARARHMLRHVGLGGFEDARPDALSGGMRQRAAIARALLTDPSLLLMDEPFGALDALTRERMNLQLSGIAEESGCAVLLITHSIAEAVFLADRVVVMTARPGRIADEIPVDLPRPRGPDTLSHPAFAASSERLRRHFHVDRHGLD